MTKQLSPTSCGQLPLGGCANPDLGHSGPCTPVERKSVMTYESEIARAEKHLERLYAAAERTSVWGENADYPEETVLLFKLRFPASERSADRGRVYTYVVTKVMGRWYISGPRNGGIAIDWRKLVEEFLVPADEVWIASEWEQV